jgi:peptidoglycan/LPS O-acetylase OafA/YrhL
MPAPTEHARHQAGLDTLRALAIGLVFMYHYMVFVSREPTFGWLSEAGWVGWTCSSCSAATSSPTACCAAGRPAGGWPWALLRAAHPAHLAGVLVVLAAYFLWPDALGGRTPPPLWRFLTFTQNWNLPTGTAFSHAWSLCIEEQFYALLPLAVLGGGWLARRRGWGVGAAWAGLALLLATGVGTRAWLWQRTAWRPRASWSCTTAGSTTAASAASTNSCPAWPWPCCSTATRPPGSA